jgi:hypothetical protein
VAVFDFYNVLTSNGGGWDANDYGLTSGNHHRVVTTTMPITIKSARQACALLKSSYDPSIAEIL